MKNENYEPIFITIPFEVFKDRRLQTADKNVYGVIFYYTKMNMKICIASNRTIAGYAGVKTGTVRNSLSKLNRLGYINTVYQDEDKKIRIRIDCLVDPFKKDKTLTEKWFN